MSYVIETLLKDGPHWYSGIGIQEKDGAVIQGPLWSPYWEDVKELNERQAAVTFNAVCHEMPGAKIVPIDIALKKDAWKYLGDGRFSVRAKYVQEGYIVQTAGFSRNRVVCRITEKTIILRLLNTDGYPCGDEQRVGRNSSEMVTVVGRKKTKEVK